MVILLSLIKVIFFKRVMVSNQTLDKYSIRFKMSVVLVKKIKNCFQMNVTYTFQCIILLPFQNTCPFWRNCCNQEAK